MIKEPYRIKAENGKITISLFDLNSPIPHTYYKGRIFDKKTQDFLKTALYKINDKQARSFIKSFITIGDYYTEKMKKDFKDYEIQEKK
jgi:hypothetical protein